MRKLALFIISGVTAVVLAASPAAAQTDFFIDAYIPPADGAVYTVSKVTPGTPDVFEVQAAGFDTLDFGQLDLDAGLGIFLPAYFWVVDVGTNGAGFPDLQFAYVDTFNPNGALNDGSGLGGHGTVAYLEVVDNGNGTQTVNLIRGESLNDANSSGGLDETQYANGFARISFGIATGDPGLEEGNAVPFTPADATGTYSGTFTITASFDVP